MLGRSGVFGSEYGDGRPEEIRRGYIMGEIGGSWVGFKDKLNFTLKTSPRTDGVADVRVCIECVEFCSEKTYLAAGSTNGVIYIYKWSDFRYDEANLDEQMIGELDTCAMFNNVKKVCNIRWIPQQSSCFLAVSSLSKYISKYDVEYGPAAFQAVTVSSMGCFDLTFDHGNVDHSVITCACRGGTTSRVDFRTGKSVVQYKRGNHGNIHAIKMCDTNLFATGTSRGIVSLWDTRNCMQPVREYGMGSILSAPTQAEVHSLDVMESIAAVRLSDGTCSAFDLVSAEVLLNRKHCEGGIEKYDERRAKYNVKFIQEGIILSHTEFNPVVEDIYNQTEKTDEIEEETGQGSPLARDDDHVITSVAFDDRSMGIICGMTSNRLHAMSKGAPEEEELTESVEEITSNDIHTEAAAAEGGEHEEVAEQERTSVRKRKAGRRKQQRTLNEHWGRTWSRLDELE